MLRLREGLESVGYHPFIVLYLRSQAEYLESMYCTLVLHGYTVPFDRYVAEALANGVIHYRGIRSYRVDYDVLLEKYAEIFGEDRVIVRPYEWSPDTTKIIYDFLAAIGFGDCDMAAAAASLVHQNVRPALVDVARELLKNAHCDPSAKTMQAFEAADREQRPFQPFDAAGALELKNRFDAGNERVRDRWGVSVEAASGEFITQRSYAEADSRMQTMRVLLGSVADDLAS
jgi:hypothetical protein